MAGAKDNENAVTHGAYHYRDQGEKALTAEGRSRRMELLEQIRSKPGVVELVRERAADAILLCELCISYAAQKNKEGIPLDKIAILSEIHKFQNSAYRALQLVLQVTEHDLESANTVELERIKGVIEDYDQKSK